jgi:protein-disulfide isomerase
VNFYGLIDWIAMRLKSSSRLLSLAALTLSLCVLPLHAQFSGGDNTTKVNDPAFLKPPAGAKVAIIVFEDLECPSCGHDAPILRAAAARYKVPLLRHDFPLPMHTWAYDAAVNARWFESQSYQLGEDYRLRVFANQTAISTKADLFAFTERFAKEKGIALPFVMDPQGALKAKVDKDANLGKTKVVIDHTPTIWVVTRTRAVEIKTPDQIDSAISAAIASTK